MNAASEAKKYVRKGSRWIEEEKEFQNSAEPEEEVIFDDKNAVVQLTNFSYDYVNLNTHGRFKNNISC